MPLHRGREQAIAHQRQGPDGVVCLNPRYSRDRHGELIFTSLRLTPDANPVWGRPPRIADAPLHSMRQTRLQAAA
jgi:hypothetical protein